MVEEKVLLGLITRDDPLAQLTEMMAVEIPSIRVTIRMPNVKGKIAKLAKALSEAGLGIAASGICREPTWRGYTRTVVKI